MFIGMRMLHVSYGEWLFISVYRHVLACTCIYCIMCLYVYKSPYIYMSACVHRLCHVSLYVWASLWASGTSPATF